MDVGKQKEQLNGSININTLFMNVINDYEDTSRQYTMATGDAINQDPVMSVRDFPLKECRYTVSVVIPAWNSRKSLEYTLKSLCYSGLLRKFPEKTEVIIVDDGSDDDIQGLLSCMLFPYQIRYIRQYHLGRAQAINMAIHHSESDIIIFCDADLIITPYAFDELIKRQQIALHDAIFFGFREDIEQNELPSRIEECLDGLAIDLQKDNRFLTDFPGLWGTNMMLETELLQGMTCKKNIYVTNNIKSIYDCWQLYRMPYGFLFSVSRKNIIKVGGFAEYLKGWGFDDTEFCAKSILQGVRLIPVPSAFVGHIQHPIREKTQWEDGARNQQRMEERLRSLNFNNYIVDDLDERIEVMKTYNPSVEFENIPDKWCSYRCVQTGCQYQYILGNIDNALDILEKSDLRDLSYDDIECLLDIAIRLKREDIFHRIQDDIGEYSDSYYYKLCSFVFDGVEPLMGWTGKYMDVARNLGAEELCKRADRYFDESQWYLAMLDYFGAYLLTAKKKDIIQKCKTCSERILIK